MHTAGGRVKHAGEEVNQGRFAGTVRANDGMPGAGRQGKIDIPGDIKSAEIFIKTASF
jgi:hypothetical protein